MEFLLVNTKNCNQIFWHIHLKTGLIWINWQIYASLIGLAQIFCHLSWCHQKCILLKIIRKFAWLKLNYYLQNWESRLQSIKFWKISSQIKINHFLHELFLFFNQSASCLHYSGRGFGILQSKKHLSHLISSEKKRICSQNTLSSRRSLQNDWINSISTFGAIGNGFL